MIRRFLTTFVDQQISSSSDFLFSSNGKAQTSFLLSELNSLDWLHSVSPCFPIHGDQISIIHNPRDFYNTIVTKCSEAKKRICLASLYLGTGELEHTFVKTIHDNLKQNLQLKVKILLDFTRGTRGDVNSKTMLMPLVRESNNCELSLYHTPVLRGLTKRLAPPRWNELLGLQHMKIYLFDDSVLISGANLSNDYFTNRQDRYILVEDKPLADFYTNFISKVQEFSLRVNETAEVKLHNDWEILPYEGATCDFASEARKRIFNFFDEVTEAQKTAVAEKPDADTWVFPLIEMGQLGIHHDSVVTKRLFSSSVQGSKFKLATGYFNLTQDYMDTITHQCLAHCSILMAHPNANGFQGAKGPAGGIPAAYTLIAKNFYKKLIKANQEQRVSLFEYEKDGWSYHAKGLWYYLPNSNLPNLTLIGSSNFGERSVNRDLENQICVVTSNKSLQKRLQNEVDHLYQMGSTAENEITSRPVPKWVRAVVGLFRNFF